MRLKAFCTGFAAVLLLLAASAATAGVVYKVFPSGSDDTVNIENAFLSCVSSGPDCTVKLAAGTFYISRPIVIANFDGTFRGQGKDKTVIRNIDSVPFPVKTTGPEAGLPSLFFFYRDGDVAAGSLNFSDMSVRVTGPSEIWSTHSPDNQWNTMVAISVRGSITGIADFEPSALNTSFKRMAFAGEAGEYLPGGFNLLGTVDVFGEQIFERGETLLFRYGKPLVGTFVVKDCDFKSLSDGVLLVGLEDSEIVIGGRPRNGNSFDNVNNPITFIDLSNSVAKTSFNQGTHINGVGIQAIQAAQAVFGNDLGPVPELFPERSTYSIYNNDLHLINYGEGIGLLDFGALVGLDATLNAVVAGNKLTLDSSQWGGIWGYAAQDALVLANRISGTGFAGIYFGAWGDPSSHWIVAGNDVNDMNAAVAPIWLGPGTSENLVITRNPEENVLDEGTDNSIIGY